MAEKIERDFAAATFPDFPVTRPRTRQSPTQGRGARTQCFDHIVECWQHMFVAQGPQGNPPDPERNSFIAFLGNGNIEQEAVMGPTSDLLQRSDHGMIEIDPRKAETCPALAQMKRMGERGQAQRGERCLGIIEIDSGDGQLLRHQ